MHLTQFNSSVITIPSKNSVRVSFKKEIPIWSSLHINSVSSDISGWERKYDCLNTNSIEMTQIIATFRIWARKSFHISFLTRVEAKSQLSHFVIKIQQKGTIAFIKDNAKPGINELYNKYKFTIFFNMEIFSQYSLIEAS